MHRPIVQYPVSKNLGPNRVLVTDENGKLPKGSSGAYIFTTLTINQTIAADTNFSLTSSGTGYTHSNDVGSLPESAALFNADGSVRVFVSGVLQENGVGAIWVNTTTFKLNAAVDNGDVIVIFS